MVELFVAVVLGVFLGTVTGLVPGLHINLVAALLLSSLPLILPVFPVESIAVLIIAMAVTHVLLDFIPSIFLGAPSSETALAVLPGHALLLEGKGKEAVMLALTGGITGLLLVAMVLPLMLWLLPVFFPVVQPFTGVFLLFVALFSILRERIAERMLWSAVCFVLAGLLGLLTFSIPNLGEPLLPLLSGLFGASILVFSLFSPKRSFPAQDAEAHLLRIGEGFRTGLLGVAAGALMALFPAVGPAQSAVLARTVSGEIGVRRYLFLLGAIGSSSLLFSLPMLAAVGKARNGAVTVISQMISVDAGVVMLLTGAGLCAIFPAILVSRAFLCFGVPVLARANYRVLSLGVLLFLLGLTGLLTGSIGLLVLLTGTAIGLVAAAVSVPRHHLMACLLVPVFIYYIPFE
jgi:putative membrane protein